MIGTSIKFPLKKQHKVISSKSWIRLESMQLACGEGKKSRTEILEETKLTYGIKLRSVVAWVRDAM